MINLDKLNLPFTNILLIITILFIILLIAPIISKALRIPSIIGLIVFGAIIGPNGFGIIPINDGIKILSEIGLIFIIFLAGIELDFNQLKKNKQASIFSGFITATLPSTILFIILFFFFDISLLKSILISLIFSTQTLVAYPIVSRFGLTNNRSSITAIGGTIISDALILFAIGIIVTSHKSPLTITYISKLILNIISFMLIVTFLFPYIVKKIFTKFEDDNYLFFLLILSLVFLSATLAYLVGLEGIIGAFLAGITLNRYIPKTSSLMTNLKFIGNSIFIPCFLFFVGTLVNFKLIFENTNIILFSSMLVIIAITSKYLASYITGKIFNFNKNEIYLLFGLSSTRAAAVIAVTIVCFTENLISSHILNASVLLIATSCIIGSIVTEKACRKLILSKSNIIDTEEELTEKILVPYANPNNINKLLDIAAMQFNLNTQSIIYPLAVITENTEYKQTITTNKTILEKLIQNSYPKYIQFQPTTRIDTNPVSGILRATKELMATTLIIGWTGQKTKFDILGSNIDTILEHTSLQTLVCHINQSVNIFSKLIITVPKNAEFEKGFKKWLFFINSLTKNASFKAVFISNQITCNTLQKISIELNINTSAEYHISNSEQELINILENIYNKNSLIFIISGRNKSISFDISTERILQLVTKPEKNKNFIILFPEEYN